VYPPRVVLSLYRAARNAAQLPAWLDSAGSPAPGEGLSLLGVRPTRVIEVRDGATWLDGRRIGGPLEILHRLEDELGTGHFPAWIGFFAYEYARHLGLRTREPLPGLPEARFHYYPEGYVFREGVLVASPTTTGAPPPGDVDLHKDAGSSSTKSASRLHCDLPEEGFLEGVRQIQERIRAGEVYQVNLSSRFRLPAEAAGDPLEIFARLRTINPSPFMGLLEGPGWAVVSGSPERLFSLGPRDAAGLRRISTRPIAGTRPRGRDEEEDRAREQELRSSAKERAEHVMLVDLLRNDLARCSEPGTVEVSEAFTVERYSHVMHLVSEVRGQSRASFAEIFASVFPGGTITGAPKGTVMDAIAELEPVPRGAYTGSLGYVSGMGADFNILIRSFTFAGEEAFLSFGGGVVIQSDPAREYAETQAKAAASLVALGQGSAGRSPASPSFDSHWSPPLPARRIAARVRFVENRDSFSYNVIDYLRSLGAAVEVVDGRDLPALGDATHLVVGPGPGEPETAGHLLSWIHAGLAAKLPLLGVCLGHQALGVALGARLRRASRPVHGELARVRHSGEGIFEGLPDPAPFARYHSLVLDELPSTLEAHAWTEDGVNMAIADPARLAWGVQFHPESMLSIQGMELFAAFLALERP